MEVWILILFPISFTIISAKSFATSSGVITNVMPSGESSTEIIYTVPIGSESRIVHPQVCAGDQTLITPTRSVVPQQNLTLNVKKILPAHTCQNYEEKIQTSDFEMIEVY